MADPTDELIKRAVEQGERNAEAITLIERHCAHAEVELSPHHGVSSLERPGLPISARIMRCPFGPKGGPVGMDLLQNALGFYGRNCIGCEHREPKGIPNLATVAETIREENEKRARARTEAEHNAEVEREAAARRRAERVASEPQATRHLIGLLDPLQADPNGEAAREFADLCRLQPELCTEVAGRVLLEAAETITSERFFEGLDHLGRAGRLVPNPLLKAAVEALSRAPLSNAAAIVVHLGDRLVAGQLRPALPAIVRLAGPVGGLGFKPKGDVAPMALAARNELPALLDTLIAEMGSADKYRRSVGARAAERLIEMEPGTAAALAPALIDSLSLAGSLGHYAGEPRENLLPALGAAFRADPSSVGNLIETRAPGLEPAVRSALFHALDRAVWSARKNEGALEAAGIAIDSAFRRVGGDWGKDVAGKAARLISSAARYLPQLMVGRIDQLFGALLQLTASPSGDSPLEVPPTVPPILATLEAQARAVGRRATIRELREAIGSLVPHAPQAVAANVFAVVEAPDPAVEEGKELRDQAVRLLGDLGKRPDLLPEVLPRLYSALLNGDQRVRAAGIEAWAEIATPANRELPSDLGELLPQLLADRYKIVHQAAITAIRRGLPVAEPQLVEVVDLLGQWVATYVAEQDPATLDTAIQATWGLSRRLTDDSADRVREHCLGHARHLIFYDKRDLIERRRGEARHLPSFLPRLLEVLSDPEFDRADQRDDTLLRELRDQPFGLLASHASEIIATAQAYLPQDIWQAHRFIEILQRAGLWEEAATLAEEILATVPDTPERALNRQALLSITEAARAEAAIARDDFAAATTALGRAAAADAEHTRLAAEQEMPWELEE